MRWRWFFHVGHDGGDEFANLLDLVLASGANEVAGEDLSREQRGPGDPDFGLGGEQFPAVEGLHGELDDELVGGQGSALRGLFEPLPLLGLHADAHKLRCETVR